jgi:hypothetical protein
MKGAGARQLREVAALTQRQIPEHPVMTLRHPLARSIAWVLALKIVLLVAGFWLLFGPDRRPTVTPQTIDGLILPSAPGERSPLDPEIEAPQ